MLPSSQYQEREPLMEHIYRKSKEQPLVPIGCLATVSALYLSGRALRARNSNLANRMFYWRVASQAFTVGALLWGGWYYGEGYRKQEQTRLEKLREIAKDRERLWLEELDRIDAEAKKVKARAAAIKRGEKQGALENRTEQGTEQAGLLDGPKEMIKEATKEFAGNNSGDKGSK